MRTLAIVSMLVAAIPAAALAQDARRLGEPAHAADRSTLRLAIEPEVGFAWSEVASSPLVRMPRPVENVFPALGAGVSAYGRAADWLWLGARLRLGAQIVSIVTQHDPGYERYDGPVFLVAITPSVRASFRRPLSRDLAIEGGAHLDVGLAIGAGPSDAVASDPMLDLALGIEGALRFARSQAIGLDLALEVVGLGNDVQIRLFPSVGVWPALRLFYAVYV